MKNFYKKLFLVFLTLQGLFSFSQDGSLSPYSFFGFGDEVPPQIINNAGMGHLNFFNDSIHYNFMIPSSLANLHYVNYSLSLSQQTYNLESGDKTSKGGIFLTPYISLGIPIKGIGGVGIGFRPYSSTGFLLKKEYADSTVAKTGEGGLNQFFFQAGIKVYKGLNLGLGMDYYFGHRLIRYITYRNNVFTVTRQLDDAVYRGKSFNFSLDYTGKLPDFYYKAALRYRTRARMTANYNRKLQLSNNAYGVEIITDETTLRDDTVRRFIPPSAGFGLGFGKMKKWFVGLEYEQSDWRSYSDDFFTAPGVRYTTSSSFKIGGFYQPDYRLHVPLWKRITYKAGFYARKGSLVIQNQQINEFGTTFGLSIPLGGYFSKIDVSAEYIQRGPKGNELIHEKIFGLKIGLSFNDLWFRKRKIN